MKKVFTIITVLALVLTLGLVGCGQSQTGNQNSGSQTSGEPKLKVGVVFDIGGRGDKSFNDSAYRGLVKAAKELGGYIKDDPDNVNYGTNIEMKYLEPKQGGADREQLLRKFAEAEYDLVIGVGFAFTDAIKNVANDFPDVHFAIIDSCYSPDDHPANVTCLLFKEQEGSFLVGAISGYKTETNKIGFIGGMDIPLIRKFMVGYEAGAMYVNPELRKDGAIVTAFVSDDPGQAWNNPPKGKEIAISQYDQGADIIYHAAGGTGMGLFEAALEKDKWAIGVDSDQGLILATSDQEKDREMAKHIITSMLKRVDTAVYTIIKEMYDNGKVEAKVMEFGLKENGVGYAYNDYNKELLDPIKPQVDELKQKIINGEITVPATDDELQQFKAKLGQ